MIIAHLSDTHLGRYMGEDEERERDHYEAFREAVDFILEDHVRIVVHSGDILNKPLVYGTPLKVLLAELGRLSQSGVKTYFTLGEHDIASYPGTPNPLLLDSVLGLAEYVGDGRRHGDDKISVFGLMRHHKAFTRKLEDKLEKIAAEARNTGSRRKILILHQGLHELHGPAGDLSLAVIPDEFDYYAMGHIHNPSRRVKGRGLLAYPGALHWTKIDDPDECGFYLVDLSGREPELEWVRLSNVRPKIVRQVDEEDVGMMVSQLLSENHVKKPLLSLMVRTTERKNMRKLEEELSEKYLLHGGRIMQVVRGSNGLVYDEPPNIERELVKLASEVIKDDVDAVFFTGEFRRLLVEGAVKHAFELVWKHYRERCEVVDRAN